MSERLGTIAAVSLSLSLSLALSLAGVLTARAADAAPAPAPAAPAPGSAAAPASSPPAGYPPAGYPPAGYPPAGYPPATAQAPPSPWNQPAPPPPFLYPPPTPPGYGYPYPPPAYVAGRAPVRPAGWHAHDGIYLRTSAGLADTSNTTRQSAPSRSTASGGGVSTAVAIGGAVIPNVILYGALSLAIGGTTLHDASQQLDVPDATFAWVLLGGGLAYYLDPENVFFSATLGASELSVDDQYGSHVVETKLGFGMDLQIGKEWWVSSSWGLGLAAQFLYGSSNDLDPARGRWTTYGGALLFSATYN